MANQEQIKEFLISIIRQMPLVSVTMGENKNLPLTGSMDDFITSMSDPNLKITLTLVRTGKWEVVLPDGGYTVSSDGEGNRNFTLPESYLNQVRKG